MFGAGGSWNRMSIARIAAGLGVSWHTANDAVCAIGQQLLIADPTRFDGVRVGQPSSGPLSAPLSRPHPYARRARSRTTSRPSATIAARNSSQSGCSPAMAR